MTEELAALLADTEAQLAAARVALAGGLLIDLSEAVPRLERLCRLAVETRAVDAAPRLAGLIEGLDTLQAQLRQRLQTLVAADPLDPARAALRYRAALNAPAPANRNETPVRKRPADEPG